MIKNITLSAEERLIQKARQKAGMEHKSLNIIFREWLKRYVGQEDASKQYRKLMKKLSYFKVGRKLTREEMNER